LSIFIVKNGKKRLPRSFYFKILIFFGLIGLSVVGMMPLQAALGYGMEYIRDNFIKKAEDLTGLEIHYSSIRPVLLNSFDIRNLRFEKDGNNFITVSHIKIKYSIWELLLNKKTFIHTVIIENPVFEIDAQKDKETFELLASLFGQNANNSSESGSNINILSEILPHNADYQIHGGYFYLIDKGTEYKIDKAHLVIKEENGSIYVNGSFNAAYNFNSSFEKIIILKTDVGINGRIAGNLEKGKADISLNNTLCSQQDMPKKNASFFNPQIVSAHKPILLFSINPFDVKLDYNERLLTASQMYSNADSNYQVQLKTDSGFTSAKFNFNKFKFSEHINFYEDIEHLANILLSEIDGSASFNYENASSFAYTADIKSGDTLRAQSNPLTDAFLINAYGSDKSINIKNFILASSASTRNKTNLFQGKIEFAGDINFNRFKVNGNMAIDHFSLSGSDSMSAIFNILSNNNEIKIHSNAINLAQAQIDDFNVNIYPAQKDTAVILSCFTGEEGEIALDALYNKNQEQLEAALSLRALSIYDISEFISPFTKTVSLPSVGNENLKKSIVNADIFVQRDSKNIVYNAPNISINYGETTGRFAVAGTDKRMVLSDGILIFDDDNELLISSNINFSNPKDLFFNLSASLKDLSWNIDGQVLDRSTLIVRDPNGLNIYGNTSSTGEISGYIEGKDYPFLINSQTVYFNFYSSLRFTSQDFWNLTISKFSMRDSNTNNGDVFFMISGSADQNGAGFRDIKYTDAIGTLAGNADFSWDPKFSYMDFDVMITDGREAGEHYSLEGTLRNDHLKLDAAVSELHLNRYLKKNNPLLVSADINITWDSIDMFNADIDVKSLRTRIGEEIILASVGVNMNNDELFISDFKIDFGEVLGYLPELQLNRAEGIAKARADISGTALEKTVEGNIDIDFNFIPLDSWLSIKDALKDFEGIITIGNIQYGDRNPEDFIFNFKGKEGALSVNGGLKNMLRLEMESDGTFYAGLSSPFPIQGAVVGTYDKGNINANCGNFFIDLSLLYSLVSRNDDFNITGGYITGNMEFVGPIYNPEMNGSGIASSMRFQVKDYISEDLCPAPFLILAEGYEMTFGPVVTAVGSGGGDITGWFLFENWSPVQIGLDINIPMQSPIPYDFNIAGFLAKGNASGNMSINIDTVNLIFEMGGNLFTNDADLGMNMDNLNSNTNNEYIVFHSLVDLTITTGSMVEFAWPINNPIIRANPEQGTIVYISSDTQTGQFALNGDVKLRSGEIYYVNRNFFIRQGNIVFKETETSFNPIFSTRADIRDRVDSGPVIISMIVNNQPLLTFVPRFESNPSLTQLEIYSILGQNFGVAQGEDNTDQAQRFLISSTADVLTQLIGTSDVLSQFVFFRQFERQVRDTIGFDMFSVRTRFIQNLAVTGVTGLSGQTPMDRDIRVGNYFDNTSVFIGKYIGKHMFISYMGTLRYDENSDVLGGVRYDQDIGIELNSPFVNIRWDLFPNNPQNWWVTDNSITLSWSMSF